MTTKSKLLLTSMAAIISLPLSSVLADWGSGTRSGMMNGPGMMRGLNPGYGQGMPMRGGMGQGPWSGMPMSGGPGMMRGMSPGYGQGMPMGGVADMRPGVQQRQPQARPPMGNTQTKSGPQQNALNQGAPSDSMMEGVDSGNR